MDDDIRFLEATGQLTCERDTEELVAERAALLPPPTTDHRPLTTEPVWRRACTRAPTALKRDDFSDACAAAHRPGRDHKGDILNRTFHRAETREAQVASASSWP
ncbi:hypothetical protein WJX77_000608 [Trebouxia sp. C0004]